MEPLHEAKTIIGQLLMRERDFAIALALQRALLFLEEAEYLDEKRNQW